METEYPSMLETIATVRVFTQNNQVYTLNKDQEWSPVAFRWLPVGSLS